MNKSWLDRIGVILSIGCMIHCLLLPIILPALPLLGLVFDHESGFHFVLSFIIAGVAALALVPGYKKHGVLNPIIVGFAGVMVLIAGGIVEGMHHQHEVSHTVITVFGSILMVSAHIKNHRLSCSCDHHKHGDH